MQQRTRSEFAGPIHNQCDDASRRYEPSSSYYSHCYNNHSRPSRPNNWPRLAEAANEEATDATKANNAVLQVERSIFYLQYT